MVEYPLSKRQKNLLRSIPPGLKDGSIEKGWMVLFFGGQVTSMHIGITDEKVKELWRNQAGLGDFELFVATGFFEAESWDEHQGRYTLNESMIVSAVESNFDKFAATNKAISQTPHLFISYKRIEHDTSIANWLNKKLGRVYGQTHVWLDQGLYGGQRWWDEIINKISHSDILIYLLSRESLESVYCRAELTEAWQLGKQLLPVLIRGNTIPQELDNLQHVRLQYYEDGDIKADSVVEIFASITQQIPPPPVFEESLWAKRLNQPTGEKSMRVRLKVPAEIEPDDKQRKFCNTGILVVPGDEVIISANGKVTIDNGDHWWEPTGISKEFGRYPTQEAYIAKGHPDPQIGNHGIVGSLFGWLGSDKSAMDEAFFIGDHHQQAADKAGFLHLAVNDSRGTYGDNRGEFDVTIEIKHS